MGLLIEKYNHVVLRAKEINTKIQQINSEIAAKSEKSSEEVSTRVTKLEEQLEKIDDYLLRVKGFQELAKHNLDSQNILTIDAPPGYRVNLNRLRNWASMIDPMSSNDPYAQRVYITAKCDECFLERKKEEFTERLEELKRNQAAGRDEEIEKLKEQKQNLCYELRTYAESSEVEEFLKDVFDENEKYWKKDATSSFINPSDLCDYIAPGAYSLAFPMGEEVKRVIKEKIGEYYNEESERILIPVEIDNKSPYVMMVSCPPSRRKYLDRGLQNLILSSLVSSPAGERKIYVVEGTRYNASCLGSLRELTDSFAIEDVPHNSEQLTSLLEQIASSLSDIDEIIEQYDSLREYNEATESSKRYPYSTIILYGWPNAFTGRDKEMIQRIITNYERYGISIITVNYKNSDNTDDADLKAMPEYAAQSAIHINLYNKKDSIITLPESEPYSFRWYSFDNKVSDEFVKSFLSKKKEKGVLGNEYTKRYSFVQREPYVRTYKELVLPIGIDGKDEAHTISFENENFATYLVGASRSGKSTLLHTLIASIIRNYHPDNVELWLADFKQLEFKRYINCLPPHVKYVLLDESTELVFDLVDKLTFEMLERQKLFSRLKIQRIDQIEDTSKLEKPLPVIFVILDEFSIMSQSIAESPEYKLKLQNILAKGAALGIKFIFSSQTFTTGVSGLTATARAQIQQRIAMKGSKAEITETLELSSNLKTEQVNNWIDALPPRYALIKCRISADTLPVVKRYYVIYIKDYDERDAMIEDINNSMEATEEYTPQRINTYVNKHPVLVDGNSYSLFSESELLRKIKKYKQFSENMCSSEEILVSFGKPRLMEDIVWATLTPETRENIVLFSRHSEQAYTASILMSAMKSFMLQDGKVEVWAYGRNRLYREYKTLFESQGIRIIEDLDDVCDEIYALKNSIIKREIGNKLIVLIGIERICMDFEFVDGNSISGADQFKPKIHTLLEQHNNLKNQAALGEDEEEQFQQKLGQAWCVRKKQLKNKAKEEGKSREDAEAYAKSCFEQFKKEYYEQNNRTYNSVSENDDLPKNDENIKVNDQEAVEEDSRKSEKSVHQKGAYNALEDFVYIIKQGSRLGTHFMVTLNSVSDLKQCGLKQDFFRYKMAFQLSAEESRTVFGNKTANFLPEHICQYDDTLRKYSFRPFLHKGIEWDGWSVSDEGTIINPYEELKEE